MEQGKLYRVVYWRSPWKYSREAVMSFMDEQGDNYYFSARPVAGTQEMPKSWVKAIYEVAPGTKKFINRRSTEHERRVL